jgi:hypothetical protein
MTSEQTQDTRMAPEVPSKLKEQLFTAASQMIHDPEFLDSMIPDVEVVNAVLAAIADAGYTIAGPGQVVVDRGRWEAYKAVIKAIAMLTLYDPLPTQEGE